MIVQHGRLERHQAHMLLPCFLSPPQVKLKGLLVMLFMHNLFNPILCSCSLYVLNMGVAIVSRCHFGTKVSLGYLHPLL